MKMLRICNILVAIVNFATLIFGLAAIGYGLFFMVQGHSECQRMIQIPLLIVGALMFAMSSVGLIGSCCRVKIFFIIYLTVIFLLILGLIVFTVFMILVTNKDVGDTLSGKGIKDAKLMDFSNWLPNHFGNAKNWAKIKSCLIDSEICMKLGNDVDPKEVEFYSKNLSHMQSGCCQPPSRCGFTSKNATFWEQPETGPAVKDPDCITWSNVQKTLCYDCNSCKAGFLTSIRKQWRMLAMINAIVLVIIVFIYSIGCCAMRSNSRYRKYR